MFLGGKDHLVLYWSQPLKNQLGLLAEELCPVLTFASRSPSPNCHLNWFDQSKETIKLHGHHQDKTEII